MPASRTIASLALLMSAFVLASCGNGEEDPAEEVKPVVEADPVPVAADPAPPAAGEPAPVPVAEPLVDEAPFGDPIVEIRVLNDWYRAVLIDERAIGDPLELEAIGRSICEGLQPCRAVLWYDARIAPTALPVSEDALQGQAFGFGRTIDGAENMQWNCDLFRRLEGVVPCLPRLLN